MVRTINKLEKLTEKRSTTTMLLKWVLGKLYSEIVSPNIAISPSIATGINSFLRLKISAIRQKTPKPDMANIVFIFRTYFSLLIVKKISFKLGSIKSLIGFGYNPKNNNKAMISTKVIVS